MSRKPVIEEVEEEDIDNMDMDIAQFDPSLRTPIAPLRPEPTIKRSQDEELFPNIPTIDPLAAQRQQPAGAQKGIFDTNKFTEDEREKISKFQVIYPCYFDKNRSHKDGRRVSEERAVENPLAKTISDACRQLQVPVLLELDKTHPQDFGNPGRVRVMLRSPETGDITNGRFQNKKSFLNEIASYLQKHPTTLKRIGPGNGVPIPQEFEHGFEPRELPKVKGFKMNTIVPVHSDLTMGHPMTKSIYNPEPEVNHSSTPQVPKQPKKKIMRVRG